WLSLVLLMVERHIIVTVLVATLCACADVSQQPRLTSVQVSRIADAQARSQLGERVSEFHRFVPRYDSQRRTWSVVTLVVVDGRRLESTLRLLTLQDKRGFCTSMLFEQPREPSNQLIKLTPKTFARRLADLCTERLKEKL